MTITPFAAGLIPDEVKAIVAYHRSFAEIIRELSERHEAHVRAIEAAEKSADAFGARIDGLDRQTVEVS